MSLNNILYRKPFSVETEQLVLTWKNLDPFATVLKLVTQEERCVTSPKNGFEEAGKETRKYIAGSSFTEQW